MSTQESSIEPASIIVESLIKARSDKRRKHEVAEAVGWGVDMLEKVAGNSAGVPIEKADALLSALGIAVITKERLLALTTLAAAGLAYECARLAGR